VEGGTTLEGWAWSLLHDVPEPAGLVDAGCDASCGASTAVTWDALPAGSGALIGRQQGQSGHSMAREGCRPACPSLHSMQSKRETHGALTYFPYTRVPCALHRRLGGCLASRLGGCLAGHHFLHSGRQRACWLASVRVRP
jgi:hypothetical protein